MSSEACDARTIRYKTSRQRRRRWSPSKSNNLEPFKCNEIYDFLLGPFEVGVASSHRAEKGLDLQRQICLRSIHETPTRNDCDDHWRKARSKVVQRTFLVAI